MTVKSIPEHHKLSMKGDLHTCPMRGHSTSFQLVDELGDGKPYAGLAYEAIDYEDVVYAGKLDATGFGKVNNHYRGALVLQVNKPYQGVNELYVDLITRPHYPLPITELQVRAEKTHLVDKDGSRTRHNRATGPTDVYYQVEVSELVEHKPHLPPLFTCNFTPDTEILSMMRPQTRAANDPQGSSPKQAKRFGIGLLPNRHHVLEVRPLRALRPMLSTDNEFCALNLYQLALMATLSYAPFGQKPDEQPVLKDSVSFTFRPSSGNWFGDALANHDEIWKVDSSQKQEKPYFPLYEEVPYSKRMEIVPFDPELYPQVNDPALGGQQENPANIHFLDDSKKKGGTDTQAFITHTGESILIAVRGTNDHPWDLLRDIDALQVPFVEGVGQVHRGFYEAAKVAYDFTARYLDKFYTGQKLVITGHSLGGAIALLLAEMLRRRDGFTYDILLYTYGAPRAVDQTFVDGASELVHHRMVNHNDPIPSVPGTGMDTKQEVYGTGLVVSYFYAPLGVAMFLAGVSNLDGAPYAHHGKLHHFMPVRFEDGHQSAILWEPECQSITDKAYNEILQQKNGLPTARAVEPALYASNHSMVGGYVPNSWATLRRWQESFEKNRQLVTQREFLWVDNALFNMEKELQRMSGQARPDGYQRANERVVNSLSAERDKMRITRVRLEKLRFQRAKDVKVYGDVAADPERLKASLARWKTHTVNTVAEQLAMAPPAVMDNDQAIAALIGGPLSEVHSHLTLIRLRKDFHPSGLPVNGCCHELDAPGPLLSPDAPKNVRSDWCSERRCNIDHNSST